MSCLTSGSFADGQRAKSQPFICICVHVFLTMSLIKDVLKIRDISVNFSCFCDKMPRGRNSVSEGLILALSSRSQCIIWMVLEALLTFHPQLMSRE